MQLNLVKSHLNTSGLSASALLVLVLSEDMFVVMSGIASRFAKLFCSFEKLLGETETVF